MIGKAGRTIRSLLSAARDFRDRRKEAPAFLHLHAPPILLSSLLVTGLLLGLRQFRQLQFLELAAFDRMVRLQPSADPDPRLLVVGITESDIQAQKQWPLSDRVVAQLLKTLQQYQPKAIALDLYRDIPHPPGHPELLKQLQADNVIAIRELGSAIGNGVPPPPGVPEERVGFNDLVIDSDNVLRRNLMYAQLGSKPFYSLSLRASLRYLGDRKGTLQVEPDSLKIGGTAFVPLEADSGGYQMLKSEARGWQILLNYRSEKVARQVSLSQVLQGAIEPSWVKDKLVLIGTTAASGKDLFATPYSATETDNYKMSGVIVHAQMVSQILSTVSDRQRQFWFWPQWVEVLWIWGWSLVGGILVWRSQHPLTSSMAVAIAIVGLGGFCLLLFTQAGWVPSVPAALALLATSGIVLADRAFYRTFHDALTSLPNRSSLIEHLKKASQWKKRPDFPIALLCLDIDGFKTINDSLGHQAGDWLLIETARRIGGCLSPNHLLARVGGDEFAIWLRSIGDVSEATQLGNRLRQQLSLPFNWKGKDIFTTVSVGIVCHQAGQPFQAGDLLRDAQVAMYRAKALEKNCPEVFLTGMHSQAVKRWELGNDLRKAIESQEFRLYYQPFVCLETGKVAGFEALVRWQSPRRGFVVPNEFIPVAEKTGLIIPLGQWILAEACRQMRCWHQQFPQDPPLAISVNLSGRQFSQPDLVEQIQQTLEEVGLNPGTLKLEITESMLMKDVEAAIALLKQIKDLQVRLSIDDFGTGYSSFTYLHRFPLDILKVDRSFVSRIEEAGNSAEIVRTIVMLGHNLGMDVIAEGIETEAQRKALMDWQCEYGQGYLFSKPLPKEAAAELLATRKHW